MTESKSISSLSINTRKMIHSTCSCSYTHSWVCWFSYRSCLHFLHEDIIPAPRDDTLKRVMLIYPHVIWCCATSQRPWDWIQGLRQTFKPSRHLQAGHKMSDVRWRFQTKEITDCYLVRTNALAVIHNLIINHIRHHRPLIWYQRVAHIPSPL